MCGGLNFNLTRSAVYSCGSDEDPPLLLPFYHGVILLWAPVRREWTQNMQTDIQSPKKKSWSHTRFWSHPGARGWVSRGSKEAWPGSTTVCIQATDFYKRSHPLVIWLCVCLSLSHTPIVCSMCLSCGPFSWRCLFSVTVDLLLIWKVQFHLGLTQDTETGINGYCYGGEKREEKPKRGEKDCVFSFIQFAVFKSRSHARYWTQVNKVFSN